MLQNLIVLVIVAAALGYAWARWLRPGKQAGGCGSGCNTCGSCDAPSSQRDARVIMMRNSCD